MFELTLRNTSKVSIRYSLGVTAILNAAVLRELKCLTTNILTFTCTYVLQISYSIQSRYVNCSVKNESVEVIDLETGVIFFLAAMISIVTDNCRLPYSIKFLSDKENYHDA